jgi:D-glycero-alpha-D-manno-heptose 1-phosphate guanylyltransferase
MIEAIILAGGLGTRLAAAVPHLPKALAPIQGTAFLDLLLKQLKSSGILSKAVLAAGFRAQAIRDYYQNNPSALPLEFSMEETPLGTGGALLEALSKTTSETLLVLNGDCFTDLSYKDFLNFHKKRQSPLSFAVLHSEDLSRYGSIQFDETDGRVLDFQEKSSQRRVGYLSAGIYLIQREALLSFAEKPCSIETDLFPKMLPKGAFAYVHEGTFLDIGTPQSYEMAQKILQPWL